MANQIILSFISFAIVGIGLYVSFKPKIVAVKLRQFYSQYPIVHYAGEQQLTSRLFFVRLIGWVLVIVGLLALYSSLEL